jgi:hypothetical protein
MKGILGKFLKKLEDFFTHSRSPASHIEDTTPYTNNDWLFAGAAGQALREQRKQEEAKGRDAFIARMEWEEAQKQAAGGSSRSDFNSSGPAKFGFSEPDQSDKE